MRPRKMVDELNKKFNLDITVGFSQLWKNIYDGIVNYELDEQNEKGVIDDVTNDETGNGANTESDRHDDV